MRFAERGLLWPRRSLAAQFLRRGGPAEASLRRRSRLSTLILAHNHPSGVAEPSAADELITHRLKDALALVDVRILDHLIIAGGEALSFAERGLL